MPSPAPYSRNGTADCCGFRLFSAPGFTAAAWRTFDAGHTILMRQIDPPSVTGQLARAESFTDGGRLTLEWVRVARLGPETTPERVRIRLRCKTPDILTGD